MKNKGLTGAPHATEGIKVVSDARQGLSPAPRADHPAGHEPPRR